MSEQAKSNERATQIARLNDEFRQAGPNEDWVATMGAIALRDFPGLIRSVQRFDNFTADNDPWGEHDFGAIPWDNERTFWKIDYYDQQRVFGEDPLSPLCRRVLTMMLADEY